MSVTTETQPLSRKLRVAWFTPLVSSDLSRALEFTRQILSFGKDLWDVELFVDDGSWASIEKLSDATESRACVAMGCRVFPALTAFLRDEVNPFDVFFYQLENAESAVEFSRCLGLHPGVVLFHDAGLAKVRAPSPLEREKVSASDWQGKLLRDIGTAEADDIREYLLRQQQLESKLSHHSFSRAVVPLVRNIFAVNELRDVKDLAQCGFPISIRRSEPGEGAPAERSRDRGGLIGFAASNDAVPAARAAENEGYKTLLLADSRSSYEQAKSECLRLGVNSKIVLAPTLDALYDTVELCEVFVALHFDVLSDVPLAAYAALASGAPLIVYDFGPCSDFPEGAAMKIPTGRGYIESLLLCLEELRASINLRATMKDAGHEFLRLLCDPRLVVQDLDASFKTFVSGFSEFSGWREVIARGERELLAESAAKTRNLRAKLALGEVT